MKNDKNVWSEYQKKVGNKYVTELHINDNKLAYENVARAFIAKKVNKCTWITRITHEFDWNGYDIITVYYDHKQGRSVYKIKSH